MRMNVTRQHGFSASHRLHSEMLSARENEEVYGKCNNPFGHGHDYLLSVSVGGSVDLQTGLIVNIGTLDDLVRQTLSDFEHRNLNIDVREFQDLVPTTENLIVVLSRRLQQCWAEFFPQSKAHLSGVGILETERNRVEIRLGQANENSWLEERESVTVDA